MSAIGSAYAADIGGASVQGSAHSILELTSNDFLRMLITELTTQDPLAPMDNQHLLEQLSMMRDMEISTSMLKDFTGLLFGQVQVGCPIA